MLVAWALDIYGQVVVVPQKSARNGSVKSYYVLPDSLFRTRVLLPVQANVQTSINVFNLEKFIWHVVRFPSAKSAITESLLFRVTGTKALNADFIWFHMYTVVIKYMSIVRLELGNLWALKRIVVWVRLLVCVMFMIQVHLRCGLSAL